MVKAEHPFESTSALLTRKIELNKYGAVEVSIKVGIKYKSKDMLKVMNFRWY
jgi:hypothetical protein